jgi:hypothetical protein
MPPEPAGYSGTPLARKLGIRDGQRVLLLDAPDGWSLPEPVPDVRLRRQTRGADVDLALVFCRDRRAVTRRFTTVPPLLRPAGALWIAWPKRASGVATDLDENTVRAVGLATGLVDVKVCAIDAVWSGLKFVRRVRDR